MALPISPESKDVFFDSLCNVSSLKLCEEPFTVVEIVESIKHLKTNKSPGTDGLTSELYTLFHGPLST